MSDTFASTRASFKRLRENWREADEDTRFDLGFWAAGLTMMAVAIVAQFGLWGFVFCSGFLIWVSANSALGRTDD